MRPLGCRNYALAVITAIAFSTASSALAGDRQISIFASDPGQFASNSLRVLNAGIDGEGQHMGSVFTTNDGVTPGAIDVTAHVNYATGSERLQAKLTIVGSFSQDAFISNAPTGSVGQLLDSLQIDVFALDGRRIAGWGGVGRLSQSFIPANPFPGVTVLQSYNFDGSGAYTDLDLGGFGVTDPLLRWSLALATGSPVPQIGEDGGLVGFVAGFRSTSFTATVPEPGVWALMILGFATVGAAVRGKRRRSLA